MPETVNVGVARLRAIADAVEQLDRMGVFEAAARTLDPTAAEKAARSGGGCCIAPIYVLGTCMICGCSQQF